MESQAKKPTADGSSVAAENATRRRLPDCILRFAAIVLTLVAAIVMGVDKQTKTISIQIASTLPPLAVTAEAKSSYASAFVYFIIVNAIACAYALVSLTISIVRRNSALLIYIGDVVVTALLFSGVGAAAAVGVLGEKGNSHIMWNKICNIYDKFCAAVAASIAISLLGSLAYLVLVLVTAVRLHRRSP